MLTACAFKPLHKILHLKTLFKNQILTISQNFIPESTINRISFTDEQGCYFAATLKKDDATGDIVIVHIEDETSQSSVDEFMDAVIDKLTLKAVSFTVLFIDQSTHGEYTTNKITTLLSKHSILPGWLDHKEWQAESRPHKDLTLEPGYEIRALDPSHTLHIVNRHYNPRSDAAREVFVKLINNNINLRPSFGIFSLIKRSQPGLSDNCYADRKPDLTGQPIAWVTTYEDSSLGSLHCMEEYRGRGFGRALVRHAMNVMSAIEGFTFVVHVDAANEGSIKLFSSEGYQLMEKNPMMILVGNEIDLLKSD